MRQLARVKNMFKFGYLRPMQLRIHLPNLITAANAIFGLLAILSVFQNLFEWTLIFFLFGMVCDFLDGWVARWVGATSELGAQLDSLADMITSGVLPGVLVYQLIRTQSSSYWDFSAADLGLEATFSLSTVGWVGLLLPLGAAYRLARFNIDTEQSKYFKGLASPANALFFVGYPLWVESTTLLPLKGLLIQPEIITFWVIFFVFIMNSPLRMFKLKFNTLYDKIYVAILFSGSILFFILFGVAAFSLSVLLYILLCLTRNVTL